MILSTKGRYAVMAMVELASLSDGQPVTLALIAEHQDIPIAYLEQIFARLKRSGLVASVRGPGGGYRLAREAKSINIAEIIFAAEESIEMTRCGGEHKPGCVPNKGRCSTHDLWHGLTEHIRDYLASISLADVSGRQIGRVVALADVREPVSL